MLDSRRNVCKQTKIHVVLPRPPDPLGYVEGWEETRLCKSKCFRVLIFSYKSSFFFLSPRLFMFWVISGRQQRWQFISGFIFVCFPGDSRRHPCFSYFSELTCNLPPQIAAQQRSAKRQGNIFRYQSANADRRRHAVNEPLLSWRFETRRKQGLWESSHPGSSQHCGCCGRLVADSTGGWAVG